ncbi:MAG: AAA family ATPase, partial [Thermoprotei archaeon]
MSRNESNEIELKVAEAKQRDVGRGIVRIDRESMRRLGVEAGDVVEIIGRKSTVAIVWPGYIEDEGLGIIRMDGILRRNAGVSLGDTVKIRKVSVRPATKVVLAPVGDIQITPTPDFVSYIKSRLLGRPLKRGDTIEIPVVNTALRFSVVSTTPAQVVQVVERTTINIRPKPVSEAEISVPRVTYEDIGDLEEAKQKIREMVELPLKHPELFRHLGIDPPKGVLLHGPPGCGKTLLAKAVANESDAYFIAINGPEIMSKFYGESEQRLREVFKEAEEN